ncbi:MAG TPA: cysteine rich repeat-containing protein [Anaeromyxobacteraceae bacterium]|nr:cysteine rich repeat-containing protein [Anaeromyxobacteraceae bacterium]
MPRWTLLALLCSASPALAAEPVGDSPLDPTTPTPQLLDPCGEDVKRFCSSVRAGGGRVAACLREHEGSLAGACREKLQADVARARQFIREFGQACRADVEAYCPFVDPGRGRILGCLNQNQLDLSGTCQAMVGRLNDARDRVGVVRSACAADAARLCAGVTPEAGALLECLQTNEGQLSRECRASDVGVAAKAAVLVDVLEQTTRQENVREALEILQGLDSVAFSRSQILLQFDSYQSLAAKANGARLLFNPQLVFGARNEFAFQVKVPVTSLYPYAAGAPTQFGLGAVTPQLSWNFDGAGRLRQYASLGVQCATASSPPVGGPWALVPAYAVGTALARWLTLTTQLVWVRSVGSNSSYPEVNLLYGEPILAVNLPGRSYLALDTRLGWSFVTDGFFPIMKLVAGLFTDRQKSLSVSAWYQTSLTQRAADEFYRYEVGTGLAYFFDW